VSAVILYGLRGRISITSIGSIETAAYVTCCSCRKRAPLDTAKRFSPIGTIYPSGLCRVPVFQPSISGKCAKSHTT
jgi:hypothetical protein